MQDKQSAASEYSYADCDWLTNNDFHIQGSDVYWTQRATSEQTADYTADITL